MLNHVQHPIYQEKKHIVNMKQAKFGVLRFISKNIYENDKTMRKRH